MPDQPLSPFDALAQLPVFFADYKAMAQRVIDLEREKAIPEELLTLEEVCAFTKLSPKTVRAKMGSVKVIADGNHIVRFRRSDILEWCNQHTVRYDELVEQKPYTGRGKKKSTQNATPNA